MENLANSQNNNEYQEGELTPRLVPVSEEQGVVRKPSINDIEGGLDILRRIEDGEDDEERPPTLQ